MNYLYKKLFLLSVLLVGLTIISTNSALSVRADAPLTKQLAGPPEEILNGNLQLPNPAQAAIHSRTAMIPVNFEQAKDGTWQWQGELTVDTQEDLTLLVFSPEDSQWDITVQNPNQKSALALKETNQEDGFTIGEGWLGVDESGYPAKAFVFSEAVVGNWIVEVTAPSNAKINTDKADGYLVVANKKSDYQLFSHLSSYNLVTANKVGLVTYMYQVNQELNQNQDRSIEPLAMTDVIEEATMRLLLPDGQEMLVTMYDDGKHADAKANDGVFGGLIEAKQAGEYIAQVTVRGTTPNGTPFMRSSEHVFPIIESNLSLLPVTADTYLKDELRLGINLAAESSAKTIEMVQVKAEVWGKNDVGESVAVAWIGGMVLPEQTRNGLVLPLNLDTRWIGRAKAQAPFELRNIIIQDRNTHIPIAQLDVVKLNVSKLPQAATNKNQVITQEMLEGPKPYVIANRSGGGNKVMLVHGYCSPGVWQGTDFTDYQMYFDYTQNRTHDEFAQLIRDQGSNLDSFGVIGHSQGGAASLHLHTYYWSGLENATGGRLIQSVGTPYQGTALAGNLALLGEIFDVGCGTNWDMTYDGAALWLSGIPNSARDDVHFYTTSFEDKWWRYDYCNVATDVFLTDPDDGVIEKWAGQLSGANNMGHTEGQCHVFFMRDPAQTYDSSRNAQMSSAAAR